MSITVNTTAPTFTLISDAKQEVSLSDYAGKNVVLLFFPLAFTGTCTEELCTMRDNMAQYNRMNAAILGISVDSPFVLERYKQQENLNFPLLSDFNKDVSRNYGALYEEFIMGLRGVSKRAAFVIDAEGTVRYAEVLEDARELPNFAAIQETLAGLN